MKTDIKYCVLYYILYTLVVIDISGLKKLVLEKTDTCYGCFFNIVIDLLIITDVQKISSLEFQINELQKNSKKFMLVYVVDCNGRHLPRSLNFTNVLVRGFLL